MDKIVFSPNKVYFCKTSKTINDSSVLGNSIEEVEDDIDWIKFEHEEVMKMKNLHQLIHA